jgi:HAE1 family hydrophobic/amphiphilic exporter-1
LKKQTITAPDGREVHLEALGTLKVDKGKSAIMYLNGKQYTEVMGTITDNNTGKVNAAIEAKLKTLKLPKGVTWSTGGASKEMNDGFINMGIAIAVSIGLVYLVMVLSFGEGVTPFVILFAIPFSTIGALVGLFLVKEPIGMPAMMGLLMLNGIVVTNAIVLLEYIRTNRTKGLAVKDALVEAGVVRLRPILMTAIGTIGALLPLALSTEGGIISRALAVVVIGGLTTSTLLTLIIVPVLYSIFKRDKKPARFVNEAARQVL